MITLSFRSYVSVDGGFSDWTAWSSCSKSCGDTVVKSRERSCTKPPPSGGGKNCSGETFEIKLCETKPCPQGLSDLDLELIELIRKIKLVYFWFPFVVTLDQ